MSVDASVLVSDCPLQHRYPIPTRTNEKCTSARINFGNTYKKTQNTHTHTHKCNYPPALLTHPPSPPIFTPFEAMCAAAAGLLLCGYQEQHWFGPSPILTLLSELGFLNLNKVKRNLYFLMSVENTSIAEFSRNKHTQHNNTKQLVIWVTSPPSCY